MSLILFLLCASFLSATRAADCPVFTTASDLLSSAPCQTCTANNLNALETGETLCVWCYNAVEPGNLCQPLSFETGLTNPCAGKTGNNSDSFSLGGDNCDCASSEYTDCASCTSNPKCDWVETGKLHWTVDILGLSFSSYFWSNQTCRTGSPLGPLASNFTISSTGTVTNAYLSTQFEGLTWFCAQCNLQGNVFLIAVLVGLVVAIAVIALAISCLVRCCKSSPTRNAYSSMP
jgi:hypothetical protein